MQTNRLCGGDTVPWLALGFELEVVVIEVVVMIAEVGIGVVVGASEWEDKYMSDTRHEGRQGGRRRNGGGGQQMEIKAMKIKSLWNDTITGWCTTCSSPCVPLCVWAKGQPLTLWWISWMDTVTAHRRDDGPLSRLVRGETIKGYRRDFLLCVLAAVTLLHDVKTEAARTRLLDLLNA